jgi:uncharacterized membrane protein
MSEDIVALDQGIIPQPENTKPIPQQQERLISGRFEVSQYSGPLPDPEILARYEKVLHGAAERTFKLVESEQEHRHKMQEKQLDAGIADQKDIRNIEKRGQFFALLIALSSIGVAVFSVSSGQEIVASIFGVSGVGTLVVSFIQGRQNQKDSDI